MSQSKEIWKPVVGYEGSYEVSNMGRVRSVDRVVDYIAGNKRRLKGKVLKPRKLRTGYLRVNLYNGKGNGPVDYYIHRLVATAFYGEPSPDEEVNHKNFDRTDNRVDNLEWVPHSQNLKHSRDAGKYSAVKNPNCRLKLTPESVSEIRSMEGGFSLKVVAEKFKVTREMISKIWKKETWKEVA